MARIADNILLLLMGLVLISGFTEFALPVMMFLTAVCVFSLCNYLTDVRLVCALLLGYLGLAAFQPMCAVFLPVVLYGAAKWKLWWVQILCAVTFIADLRGFDLRQSCYIGLLLALALYLQWKTARQEQSDRQLIQIRDTSTELNMVLKEKNRDLMEKQDYEIYLATLKERNRIAREIHDNVGHLLSRTLLQVGAMLTVRQMARKEEEISCVQAEELDGLISIKDSLNQAMNSIRQSVHDLHDDSIDLKKAIEDILSALTDYRVRLDYDASGGIPRAVKYCFIATVREAVNNTMKHSQADEVTVILREHPAFYQLMIADNGRVEKKTLTGGIGLENMRTRAEDLKGTFRVDVQDGFRIFLSIPKQTG